MKANVGGLDRAARVMLGLVLILLAATGTIGAWGWVGLVPLATGVTRFCPLYPLLGIATCPREDAGGPPSFHENLPAHFQNDEKP